MGEYGTGGKEFFKCRPTRRVKRAKPIVDVQAGPIGRMAPWIQETLTVPILSFFRLMNTKIEEGFPNSIPIGSESVGPESPRRQDHPFASDPFLAGTMAHSQKEGAVALFFPGKDPFRKKRLTPRSASP